MSRMKLNFVQNIQQGVVDVLLYDEIGRNPETGKGISGAHFAAELQWLDQNPEVNEIRVRINSPGGYLMDGISIFNAIRNASKPCNTYIDGVAASSAGIIAMAGKKRYISDFGRLMVHAPSVAGEEREKMDPKTIESLDQFQDVIVSILSANSKCSPAKAKSYVEAETWFNANDALKNGFVDEIIKTGREIESIINELNKVTNAAQVFNTIQKFISQKPNEMSKLIDIKNKLGLDSAATDDQLETAVNNLVADNKTLKNENATLKDAQKAINKTAAEAIVAQAIKDGKFAAEKKEALIAQAENNLDNFKQMVEAIPTPAKDIRNGIENNDPTAASGKVVDGKFNGKTFREWEKSDPRVIENLLKTDAKAHNELFKSQYGVDYKS